MSMTPWEPYDDFDEQRFREVLDRELPPSEGHRRKAVRRMRLTLYGLVPACLLIQVAVFASDLAQGSYYWALVPVACFAWVLHSGRSLRRAYRKFMRDFAEKDVEVEVELQNLVDAGQMDCREAAIVLERWKEV